MPPKETPFEPSVVARVSQGLRYMVSGITPSSWFGPSQPLSPAAQELAVGRQFDYPVGVNLRITPRQHEAASFPQLRSLADNYDLLRLLIETRKDQMVKIKWAITPSDPSAHDDSDPRLAELISFFKSPDRVNPWQAWLRALLEDMLVIDAATLYPRMTRGGSLYSLELMDGATIKKVIDDTGRLPLPPDPAYQQVLKGVPAVDYTVDQLIYAPRNIRTNKLYGYSPVEQVLMTVNIALRRQTHQLQFYTEGSTPDLIFSVPATWNPDQIKAFEDKWNARLEGNTAARRRTQFVPEGAKPFNTKEAILKDEYDEWLARICCFAFSIAPTPFIKQMNRATAQTSQDAALEEGLTPLMQWVKDLMNRVIWKYFGYNDLEFSWQDEEAQDPIQVAQIDDIYVKSGVKSIDEVRIALGLDPIGMGNAYMTATGPIPLSQFENGNVPNPLSTPQATAPSAGAPLTQANGEPPPDDAAPPNPEPSPVPSKDEAGAVKLAKGGTPAKKSWAPIDRNRPAVRDARAALTTLYTDFFKKQGALIAAQVTAALGKADDAGARLQEVIDEIDFKGWDVLVAPTAQELEQITLGAARLVLNQLDLSSLIQDASIYAAAFARHRAAEMVGMRWSEADLLVPDHTSPVAPAVDATAPAVDATAPAVDAVLVPNPDAKWAITDGTRNILRALTVQATDLGWSTAEFAAKIQESTAFSASRADMIARTESAKADVGGAMAGYRASGVVSKKLWLVAEDPCDVCLANEAQGAIPLDDMFDSGDDAAPAHPRCECDIMPIVDDEDTQ